MGYVIDPTLYDEEFDEKNIEHFAANSMLPCVVSEYGRVDEPILEVTVCSSISGGKCYQNDMPTELTLIRRLADGTEYTARYTQA